MERRKSGRFGSKNASGDGSSSQNIDFCRPNFHDVPSGFECPLPFNIYNPARFPGGPNLPLPFESPPHPPHDGFVGGMRPMGFFGDIPGFRPFGYGGPAFGLEHQLPGPFGPPLSGQKRGYPFAGQGMPPESFGRGCIAKLFVGSVPRTAGEEDLRPLFEEHGHVIEVVVIKEKRTGKHQGLPKAIDFTRGPILHIT